VHLEALDVARQCRGCDAAATANVHRFKFAGLEKLVQLASADAERVRRLVRCEQKLVHRMPFLRGDSCTNGHLMSCGRHRCSPAGLSATWSCVTYVEDNTSGNIAQWRNPSSLELEPHLAPSVLADGVDEWSVLGEELFEAVPALHHDPELVPRADSFPAN